MSLLDSLKDSLKNPLAENNEDMSFALESDFEVALEKAIDARLSPEDIEAILRGDDDIDDEEDDIDDPNDDIDADTIKNLEACKNACEATMESLGIDTAGDELEADDDTSDLEIDPEAEDEILSEEALIQMCESLCINCNDAEDVDENTGDASIPKNSGDCPEDIDVPNHETGDASIPENTEDPTPEGDEDEIGDDIKALCGECESLIAAIEGIDCDDKPEIDNDRDPVANECGSETGDAGILANSEDPTPEGDEDAPAGATNDTEGDECTESSDPEFTEDPNTSVKAIAESDEDDEYDSDEDEDSSLESILDNLLANPT